MISDHVGMLADICLLVRWNKEKSAELGRGL